MISVVIPTFNRPHLLHHALASVADQLDVSVEVIVVNDGGTSVRDVTEYWARKLTLRLVDAGEHRGVSYARNLGIGSASGSYLAFLDDDDIYLPGHLSKCRALAATGLEFVYSGAIVSERRLFGRPEDAEIALKKAYQFDSRFLSVANFVHTGSTLVKNFRDTRVRFDTNISHCEDWDMWLSLVRQLQYKVGFVNEVTCVYHLTGATEGLVAGGQSVVPSPFSIVRKMLYRRWPAEDPLVARCRGWMLDFDLLCNDRVASGQQVCLLAFDQALATISAHLKAGTVPSSSLIPALISADE